MAQENVAEENVSDRPTERSGLRYLFDREGFLAPLFLLPAIVYVVALVGVPFVLAIAFSLSDVTVGDTSLNFIGLDNFKRIVKTPQFQRSLQNTFIIAIGSQVIIVVLATTLAELLNREFRGKGVVRFLIILPWATPVALGTIGWLWLLDSKFSPIDWVLQSMGLLGPGTVLGPGNHMNFLGREWLAIGSVIAVNVWRMLPLALVIVLAALTSIPKDILDQAAVDGAGFFRTLFRVKVPLILPMISIAILFGMVLTFGDMAVVFILTRGGPIYYTQVLPTWAYFTGIEGGSLAQGAAIALFLFPLLLVVAVMVLRTARRMETT